MPPQNSESSEPSDLLSQPTILTRARPMLQWSSQLSATDLNDFDNRGYVETDAYWQVAGRMKVNGGLLAVVGAQGVGKSAVLLRLFHLPGGKRLLISWSEPNEQIRDLLRYNWVISHTSFADLKEAFESIYRPLLRAEIRRDRMVPIRLPKGRALPTNIRSLGC